MKIDKVIKDFRKSTKMNQVEFSKAIGVSQGFLSKLERGKSQISGQRLIYVARIAKKRGYNFPVVLR